MQHKSSGFGSDRFITVGKAGIIIGVASSRRIISSELISLTQHVIPWNPAVDEVVNAPGFPDQMVYDNQTAAKRSRGRPKKKSGSGLADNNKLDGDVDPEVNKLVLRQRK